MQLSAEQIAVVDFSRTELSSNLYVEARAGCAKTTTLCAVVNALPSRSILALAFNASIAKELQSRFYQNPTANAKTMNAFANSLLRDFLGKFPKVNADKLFYMLRDHVARLSPDDQNEVQPNFQEILSTIRRAKHYGWVPEAFPGHWKPLISDDEMWELSELQPTDLIRKLVTNVSIESFKALLKADIDFDDQVLGAAVLNVTYPKFDDVLVDEAQDLSPVNHAMISRLCRRGARLICVGDPCQAIYGFRGADSDSMDNLRHRIPGDVLPLSTCYRCPTSIIKEAQWRAPNMTWPDGTREGSVTPAKAWTLDSIPDNATIICRKNSPVYALAFKFLRAGRSVELKGTDPVKSLLTILKKLGKANTTTQTARLKLAAYAEQEGKKFKDKSAFNDKIACCEIILDQGETLEEAFAAADRLMTQVGRIKLMTGHKAKGLQFPHVYILNASEVKKKLSQSQNANILYVMQTRAEETLTYIEMEDLLEV